MHVPLPDAAMRPSHGKVLQPQDTATFLRELTAGGSLCATLTSRRISQTFQGKASWLISCFVARMCDQHAPHNVKKMPCRPVCIPTLLPEGSFVSHPTGHTCTVAQKLTTAAPRDHGGVGVGGGGATRCDFWPAQDAGVARRPPAPPRHAERGTGTGRKPRLVYARGAHGRHRAGCAG
jgi:hypothetical protein